MYGLKQYLNQIIWWFYQPTVYSIWEIPLFWIRCFHMLERFEVPTTPGLKRCTSQMALVQSIGTAYNLHLLRIITHI